MTSLCPHPCPRAGSHPETSMISVATRRFAILGALAPAVATIPGRARCPAVGGRPTISLSKDRVGVGAGLGLRPRTMMPGDVLARAGRENPAAEVSKFWRPVRNNLAGLPQ